LGRIATKDQLRAGCVASSDRIVAFDNFAVPTANLIGTSAHRTLPSGKHH
jgi:hypothetical protein